MKQIWEEVHFNSIAHNPQTYATCAKEETTFTIRGLKASLMDISAQRGKAKSCSLTLPTQTHCAYSAHNPVSGDYGQFCPTQMPEQQSDVTYSV